MNTIFLIVLLLAYRVSSRAPNSPLLDMYDYIVVGGGPGGMTVATRLSEDTDVTVLLLEAGPIDNDEPWIRIPFFAGQGVGSTYDWNLMTVPQPSLDGQARTIPQGRALGGGTIINAMLWNRGGVGDYDDWVRLGNPGWGWFDMLPYFVKSETFTPFPSDDIADMDGIGYNPFVHGFDGPINVSFSAFIYNQTRNVLTALTDLGIPTAFDPNEGSVAGASFLPVSLSSVDQVRADARTSYNSTIYSRPNLDVWTGQHVTRILFEGGSGNSNTSSTVPGDSVGQGNATNPDGALFGVRNSTTSMMQTRSLKASVLAIGRLLASRFRKRTLLQKKRNVIQSQILINDTLRAIGVEFATNASSPRQNVTATREVIISAGAIHTPQLLKLSGIGPAAELQNHSIPVLLDLPGVGTNLQDHILVGVYSRILDPYSNQSYLTSVQIRNNETLMNQCQEEYTVNRTGPWTAGPPDGNAFPALPYVIDEFSTIFSDARSQIEGEFMPEGSHPDVLAGYDAQHDLLVRALEDKTRAAYELLNFNYGAFSNANMRPFSRGTINLNSSHPFDPPIIDPRYGSNPVDLQVLLASILFNRRILATDSMQMLQPQQLIPSLDATDSEIMDFIKRNVATEYHVSCSCPMLPINLGGVVDPNLLVYGTSNVRIVDASIMPMVPAAHLQAVVYAIGEKGADIIKAVNGLASSSTLMDFNTGTVSTITTLTSLTTSFMPTSVAIATNISTGTSSVSIITMHDSSVSTLGLSASSLQEAVTGSTSSGPDLFVTVTITEVVTRWTTATST